MDGERRRQRLRMRDEVRRGTAVVVEDAVNSASCPVRQRRGG